MRRGVAGAALVVQVLIVHLLGLDTPPHVLALVGATGVWLLVAGPHEPVVGRSPRATLRLVGRADWVPAVLGLLMASVGAYAVLSALVPSMEERVGFLDRVGSPLLEPAAEVFRLPLGALLVVLAVPIARRRRSALPAAVAVLVAIAALDLMRGPALDDAIVVLAVVAVAVVCRSRFTVRPDPATLGSALRRAPVIAACIYGSAVAAVWVTASHATPNVTWSRALGQAASMLVLLPGPLTYHGRLEFLPLAIGLVGLGGLRDRLDAGTSTAHRARSHDRRAAGRMPRHGARPGVRHAELLQTPAGHRRAAKPRRPRVSHVAHPRRCDARLR